MYVVMCVCICGMHVRICVCLNGRDSGLFVDARVAGMYVCMHVCMYM